MDLLCFRLFAAGQEFYYALLGDQRICVWKKSTFREEGFLVKGKYADLNC